MRVERKVLWPY